MQLKLIVLLLQLSAGNTNGGEDMKLPLVTMNSIRRRKTRTYLIRIDDGDALLKSQPFVKISNGEWLPVYQNPAKDNHEGSSDHDSDVEDDHHRHDEHTTEEEAYNIWWWTFVLNGTLFLIILIIWILKRLVSKEVLYHFIFAVSASLASCYRSLFRRNLYDLDNLH